MAASPCEFFTRELLVAHIATLATLEETALEPAARAALDALPAQREVIVASGKRTRSAQPSAGVVPTRCGSCSHPGPLSLAPLTNEHPRVEGWVRCASQQFGLQRCKAWLHRACALAVADAPVVCPQCLLYQVRNHGRVPTSPTAQPVFSAVHLPTTDASDFVEAWLRRTLDNDRELRAAVAGVLPAGVPGVAVSRPDTAVAEGDLTLRVGCSKREKLLPQESFTSAFPSVPAQQLYTSKSMLLFQRRGGVDVLLLQLCAAEFGPGVGGPNCRRVCLSYLEAARSHFQPAGCVAAMGGPLRSLVFRAVVQGYIAFCAQRAFKSVSIWVSPPVPGMDYLLHMRPAAERAEPRNTARLRHYYARLLNEMPATVVASHGPLMQQLQAELQRPPTAADLPLFEGDHWYGSAPDCLKVARKQLGRAASGAALDAAVLAARAAKLARPDAQHPIVEDDLILVRLVQPTPLRHVEQQDGELGLPLSLGASFPNWCSENGLQFDTLRRAKHASAKLLRDLHAAKGDLGEVMPADVSKEVAGRAAQEAQDELQRKVPAATAAQPLSAAAMTAAQLRIVIGCDAGPGPPGLLFHACCCKGDPGAGIPCETRSVRCDLMKRTFVYAIACPAEQRATDALCCRLVSLLLAHGRICCRSPNIACPVPGCNEARAARDRAAQAALASRLGNAHV